MRFESAHFRKLTGLLIAAALAGSCVQPSAPAQPRTVTVRVTDGDKPILGAVVLLDASDPTGTHTAATDVNGLATLPLVPSLWRNVQMTITAAGCQQLGASALLTAGDVVLHEQLSCHVDPSGIPLGQLAAIRGAMWPNASRCPGGLTLPYGPRPGQPDNIIATDFFANYSATEQIGIVTCLKALGYTHVVVGPIIDSDGYHGQYAPHDWHWEDAAHLTGDNFDKFLDTAQYFWDHGLAPVVFIHPDGWTFEQTRDALTPLLQLPRAQKLLRIVVPTGWEPTRYDWSSCTWALFAQWARQTLPNALILIHTVNDVDAPAGNDLRCNDDDRTWNPSGNAGAWSRVAPFIHGWLIQNGAYPTAPEANQQLALNFGAQFRSDGVGAEQHSIAWHFAGNAGWPTSSAWGDQPVLLYAGETTAYEGYWKNMPEAWRDAWGDLAIVRGAAGYLDGGTLAVPVRR